jgi:hypothetical protein
MVNVPNAVDVFAYNVSGLAAAFYYEYISAQDSGKVQRSGGTTSRTTTPASTSCTLHKVFHDPSVPVDFTDVYNVLTDSLLGSIIEVGSGGFNIIKFDDLTVTFNVQVG